MQAIKSNPNTKDIYFRTGLHAATFTYSTNTQIQHEPPLLAATAKVIKNLIAVTEQNGLRIKSRHNRLTYICIYSIFKDKNCVFAPKSWYFALNGGEIVRLSAATNNNSGETASKIKRKIRRVT